MSSKLNIVAAGTAFAATFALMSALCALAFWIAPDATLDFFAAFMHGVDVKALKSTAPLAITKGLYGVIGLGIVGFIAGVVFAATYNATSGR